MPRQKTSNQIDYCQIQVEKILENLNLDLCDPNLKDTPKRIAKMYVKELFLNIGKEFKEYRLFPNDRNYDQIIAFPNIDFSSICSHHFLPFIGKSWLLYMPNKWLIGASKVTRLINHYSKRPQLQETLTHDILNSFWEKVKPLGVMVVMLSTHECIRCRGVNQLNGGGMITSAIKGSFENPPTKQEALELIKISLHTKD